MYYLISYDISEDGDKYDGLAKELRRLGARIVLYSQWELNENATDLSLNQLFNRLCKLIDKDDGLLIVRHPPNPQHRKYQKPKHLDQE